MLRRVSEWLRDGFNATVISYGEKNSEKTQSLYGRTNSSSNRVGFVWELLKHLYESTSLDGSRDKTKVALPTISLSLWALRGNTVIE